MRENSRARALVQWPLTWAFGSTPGFWQRYRSSGSCTSWAKRTARAAVSGRRAHQRCSVEGWPWWIDFSPFPRAKPRGRIEAVLLGALLAPLAVPAFPEQNLGAELKCGGQHRQLRPLLGQDNSESECVKFPQGRLRTELILPDRPGSRSPLLLSHPLCVQLCTTRLRRLASKRKPGSLPSWESRCTVPALAMGSSGARYILDPGTNEASNLDGELAKQVSEVLQEFSRCASRGGG